MLKKEKENVFLMTWFKALLLIDPVCNFRNDIISTYSILKEPYFFKH